VDIDRGRHRRPEFRRHDPYKAGHELGAIVDQRRARIKRARSAKQVMSTAGATPLQQHTRPPPGGLQDAKRPPGEYPGRQRSRRHVRAAARSIATRLRFIVQDADACRRNRTVPPEISTPPSKRLRTVVRPSRSYDRCLSCETWVQDGVLIGRSRCRSKQNRFF
jgi:hypothetical protein